MDGKGTLIFPNGNSITAKFQSGGIVGNVEIKY